MNDEQGRMWPRSTAKWSLD